MSMKMGLNPRMTAEFRMCDFPLALAEFEEAGVSSGFLGIRVCSKLRLGV